jgi:hypothetical protein
VPTGDAGVPADGGLDAATDAGAPTDAGPGGEFDAGTPSMTARGIDSWSFVDNQSVPGPEQWTSREADWPESVLVRVYRPSGAPDCQRYRLDITR